MNALEYLLHFLARLESHGLVYTLTHERGKAVLVRVIEPEEHWDVAFFADGRVEVEAFASVGEVSSGEQAEAALERLFLDTGSDA